MSDTKITPDQIYGQDIGMENLCLNGDFGHWYHEGSTGISDAPANWNYTGSGATCNRTISDDYKLMLHADNNHCDSSPSAHIAKHLTSFDTTNKKWGLAGFDFNGSSDYIQFDDSGDWDIVGNNTDTWTIHFWVKHTDHDATEDYFHQWEDAGNKWILEHVGGGGIHFSAKSGNVWVIETGYGTGSEITDTNWHHIALVIKGTGATKDIGIYKGGTQVCYLQDADTDTFAGVLSIGREPTGVSYFDGQMDEIVIAKSNIFSASPNVGLTDTITAPTAPITEGYQKYGDHSLRLTRVSNDCYSYQDILDAVTIKPWQGKTVSLTGMIRASVANRARITIDDGVDTTSCSYNDGDDDWDRATITHTINASATQLRIKLEVNTGDTTAWFDGIMLNEGSIPLAFRKSSQRSFWRGDSTTYDFQTVDFTTDANWHDMDLSSIVPAGAKTVVFRAGVKDDVVGSYLHLRRNGQSTDKNSTCLLTQEANILFTVDITSACDFNRIVEYWFENTTYSEIGITVKSWEM